MTDPGFIITKKMPAFQRASCQYPISPMPIEARNVTLRLKLFFISFLINAFMGLFFFRYNIKD